MEAWWLVGLSVTAGVVGQAVIKLGVGNNSLALRGNDDPISFVASVFSSPLVLTGLLLYGVGALSWIAVLSRMNLSHAYPFLALNFVLIAILSRTLLGEEIPTIRWIGIGVICLGIILVSIGDSS